MLWLMEIFLLFCFKDASDKILGDEAFNIAKNSKYDRYQCGLAKFIYQLIFLIRSPLVLILQVVLLHVLDQRQ